VTLSIVHSSRSYNYPKGLFTLAVFLLVLMLSACSGGAVVFVATPLPPDTSPMQYKAPGSAFSLSLPRNWAVYEQRTSSLVMTSFAPPNSDTPLLTITALHLAQSLDEAGLEAAVEQYQTQVRRDLEHYTEQDRQLMADGSWRATGVHLLPGGTSQPVNTFIQTNGALLVVAEVLVPPTLPLQSDVQIIVNTLTVADDAPDLTPGSLAALADIAIAGVEVVNVHTWSTPQNVFFITGEIANHTSAPIVSMPIRAVLETPDGQGVAEAVDTVMGLAIPAGGFAPFSLRFGQGQPAGITRYTLSLGDSNWSQADAPPLYGSEALTWTHDTQFSPDGSLFVVGQITNQSGDSICATRATVTLFDDKNQVIAAGFVDATLADLPPGATTDYTILISEAGGTPANYIVNAQGRACDWEQ
jgi:hypothetical protein